MDLSKKKMLKNISFSLSSNIISLLISTIVIAIVPKVIGVTEYGYFQLYLFYSSYIGFFHLGWCDGIYLRYGGIYYENINKRKLSSQFWWLLIFEIIICLFLLGFIYNLSLDIDKSFILMLTIFSILFVIPKTMLSYVLQMSNRIKEYSFITIIEKVIYCFIIIGLLCFDYKDYKLLIYADIIGKLVALFLSVHYCKDIVFSKLEPFKSAWKETLRNVKVGLNLMVANIAGMLILGITRLAIENNWSIEVFGKVSLAISVSNMLMVFVNAVGTVLFPMLKRTDDKKLNSIYYKLRDGLMIPLFAMLIFYYPLQYFLSLWLPDYIISFRYMALLFPMCIFESKMSMLVNTYMKALRKEKVLLIVNTITVFLSIILTGITVYIMNNLEMAVISILLLFAFRCIICEFYLSKIMGINVKKDIILEFLLSFIFVTCTWFLNSVMAGFIYLVLYIIYLFNKRDTISDVVKVIKGIYLKKSSRYI